MESKKELLSVKDLSVCYHAYDDVVSAVNHVSFSLEEGETLGLVGETGAGKTTTALGIMRLLPKRTSEILSGEIVFRGQNLLELPEKEMFEIRGSQIAMIFQDPMTALNPLQRVGQQIAEVINLHWNLSREETAKKVDEIMESVGLPAARKDEYPHQFSGGMKQRIVIAIALACNPSLLIADEPTTALDVTIQAQILHMIETLKKERNTSMILITHDLGIVVEMCNKVAIMYAGEIVEAGTVEDIYEDRRHPYTIGLFNSVPNLEDEQERLTPINGLMPDPVNLPGGCKFHPRCPYATDRCREVQPANVEVKPGHFVQCHLAETAAKEE
ncbi:MAG: ABC transporter ATP-binding protein [Oscillospiraceae bacterium]